MIKRIVFPQEIVGLRKEFCVGDLLNGKEISRIAFDDDNWIAFIDSVNMKIAYIIPMPGTIFYYD